MSRSCADVVSGRQGSAESVRGSVAALLRRYLGDYLKSHRLSPYQHKVLRAIRDCRSAALGGHVYRCSRCGYNRYEYDSCRNRHCPQCQVYQKVKWVAARLAELLPIAYYHTIFTMPHTLNELVLYNKELLYDLFFKATSHALNVFAQDARFLGAKLGFIGILHTWGQALNQHIHIHYIVTGGGLSADGKRWVNLPYRKKFLFPAKAVSKRVRREFARLLWKAYRENKLVFADDLASLEEPAAFERFLNKVAWQEWKCYMKRPFGGQEVVVKYIGRYTHRVAISDSRINSISDGEIEFSYKKYHNNKVYARTMRLSSSEFIRRFLLHVIPAGFKRIRHFGFLSSGSKSRALQAAGRLLQAAADKLSRAQSSFDSWFNDAAAARLKCPQCQTGLLEICEVLAPRRWAPG